MSYDYGTEPSSPPKTKTMPWNNIDEYFLTEVFDHLSLSNLYCCFQVCRWWCSVGRNDLLWKRRLHRQFNTGNAVSFLPPGAKSWRAEFKRLHWSSPTVLSEELRDHGLEVTNATFSGNGRLLATCGRDAMVFVYETGPRCKIIFSEDLNDTLGWQSAEKCDFNGSDTMLLVSGVRAKDILGRGKGEMVVFSVAEDFQICSKISSEPCDSMGCWFSNKYVISADFKWLAHKISTSMLWMNKIAPLSSDSRGDHTLACMRCLFKFYNPAGNAVRQMVVSNVCKNVDQKSQSYSTYLDECLAKELAAEESVAINTVFFPETDCDAELPLSIDDNYIDLLRSRQCEVAMSGHDEKTPAFLYRHEYYDSREKANALGEDEWVIDDDEVEEEESCDDDDFEWEYFDEEKALLEEELKPEFLKIDEGFEIINESDKWLIFTTGARANCPHQVGLRRMTNVRFRKHMDLSKSLREREVERRRKKADDTRRYEGMRLEDITNWSDYPSVSHMFDHIDTLFDFRGRVVGIGTSPDSRFLYVTYHPWPRNLEVHGQPCPVASRVDCAVIDLTTKEVVGQLRTSQSAFVSNKSCELSTPSVSKSFVGFPNGDETASLWDRHFGIEVCRYENDGGRILGLSLSSSFEDMCVTVSEDMTVRVWRSKESMSTKRS